MPCTYDTSHEDNLWDKAVAKHHNEIETILEELLEGTIKLKVARERTKASKHKFAAAYGKIFGGTGYNQDSIKKEQARLLGKWT